MVKIMDALQISKTTIQSTKSISINDLVLVLILSIITLIFILISPLNEFSVVRIFIGLIFLLALPGYSLISAIFVRKDELDFTERILLSFGVSFSIIALLCLILDYTKYGIKLLPVTFSIYIFIIVFCTIAHILRRNISENSFYISFNVIKLPKSIVKRALLSITILGLVLVFYLYTFHPFHSGTIIGSIYSYGYFYIKNIILSTGHLPNTPLFEGDTGLHNSIEHHLSVDYLRPATMAILQIVCGADVAKYPVTTVISFTSFLLVTYYLTKDKYISVIGSLAFVTSPLLLQTHMIFNGMPIAISIILLLTFFATRIITKNEDTKYVIKNFLFILLLVPVTLRFYHSIPFYVVAWLFSLMVCIPLLYMYKKRVNVYLNLKVLLYICIIFLLGIFAILSTGYAGELVKNAIPNLSVGNILSKIMGYLSIKLSETQNLEFSNYLYNEPTQFYNAGYILIFGLSLFSILALFYLLKNHKQYLKIVIFSLILTGCFAFNFILLAYFNLIGRAITVFFMPTLLLLSTLGIHFQKVPNKQVTTLIFAFILVAGQFLCGIFICNTPAQTYIFYEDRHIIGCQYASNLDGKVLSDIKTISLLGYYNKVDSEILADSQMDNFKINTMLKDWYYDIPSARNNLLEKDVSYISFTKDIVEGGNVYVGLNYHLQPIGHQTYKEWTSANNKIYDNRDFSIIDIGMGG